MYYMFDRYRYWGHLNEAGVIIVSTLDILIKSLSIILKIEKN